MITPTGNFLDDDDDDDAAAYKTQQFHQFTETQL
jgi:hypothetical protein